MKKEITDFKPLLQRIVGNGISQAQVAREIGLSRATVNIVLRKSNGWMPGYMTGNKLLDLAKRCGIEP